MSMGGSPSASPENQQTANEAFAVDQPSLMDRIGQALKDPRVIEALGAGLKGFGSTLGKNLAGTPQGGQVASAIQQQQGGSTTPPPPSPYLGDALTLNPQMAQTILQAMGIPGGFRPL